MLGLMRVAVVDIGTNSTRLYIADVAGVADAVGTRGQATGQARMPRGGSSHVSDLVRLSEVTRLGEGVDAGGGLSERAMGRVFTTLERYSKLIEEHRCEANIAVLTSAVRDAPNGSSFGDRVRREYGLDAVILSGEEEASLSFSGAMYGREPSPAPTVVFDVGGGSTEFIIGSHHAASFHTSLQAGVVRMSERHIHSDPPAPEELDRLARDTRAIFSRGLPSGLAADVVAAIAVAGTATSAAAIDQELDPYDPDRVHGYRLRRGRIEELLGRLSGMDESQRRHVAGLHPDRAPTIVAGMILLLEALSAFDLDEVEVSEHDLLLGGALRLAGFS